MSSMTDVEKRYFESVLGMASGYVLDYTDAKFAELFRNHQIEIHGPKYQTYGTSKARTSINHQPERKRRQSKAVPRLEPRTTHRH